MNHAKFDRPVPVFIGLGFPQEIENVLDAYNILIKWNGIPDLDRSGAIEVCRKAIRGERAGRDAREAFQRFVRGKGILAEDAYSHAASRLAQEWSIQP